MPIDAQDSNQLNYKANIRYYQKRVADLQSGFVNPVVAAQTGINPDTYISNLSDLSFKVNSLIGRIASASTGLQIPVDPATEPNVSAAVLAIDPTSNGLYISYSTYITSLQQINAGVNSLSVEDLVNSVTPDPNSNSQLIQASIYDGYASFLGQTNNPNDSYSDVISTWSGSDSNLQTLVSFANNYLSSFPSPEYTAWAFASDMYAENTQITGLTNLWNAFSPTGIQNLTSLGGTLQNVSPLTPDPNITQYTDQYLSNTNNALNGIDNLLNNLNNLTNSVCLSRFLVTLNLGNVTQLIQDLAGLLVAMRLLQTNINFDFTDLLSSFENVLSNVMRNLILNQLFNIVLQMYQRIFQPLNSWIATEETKLAPVVAICPAAGQFMQYLNGSVQLVEGQFSEMIIELFKNLELKNIQSSAKLSQATTINDVMQMISMINQIQKILSSVIATTSDPASILSSVSLNISSQATIPTSYTYPLASSPNIYNSFPAMATTTVPTNTPSLNITPDPIPWAV